MGRQIMFHTHKFASLHYTVVTGITKTDINHENIVKQVVAGEEDSLKFALKTSDDVMNEIQSGEQPKFKDVVFCAPPSGSDDYPSEGMFSCSKMWEN